MRRNIYRGEQSYGGNTKSEEHSVDIGVGDEVGSTCMVNGLPRGQDLGEVIGVVVGPKLALALHATGNTAPIGVGSLHVGDGPNGLVDGGLDGGSSSEAATKYLADWADFSFAFIGTGGDMGVSSTVTEHAAHARHGVEFDLEGLDSCSLGASSGEVVVVGGLAEAVSGGHSKKTGARGQPT